METSKYIHKSHNISVLIYHYVCPAKYRRVVFWEQVDQTLKNICLEIEKRYEVFFLEIGTDKDHVHFFVAISSDQKSYPNNKDVKKHNSKRDIQSSSGSKKTIMGR